GESASITCVALPGLERMKQVLFVVSTRQRGEDMVERFDMLQTSPCRVKPRIIKQVHGTEYLTQGGECCLRPHIDGDPVVIAATGIHIVRRMPAMPIPLGGGIASVHRILHDEFAEC